MNHSDDDQILSAQGPGRLRAAPMMRSYAVVTAAYWAFTVTDGALRMLVLLHFHTLGYTAWQIALLFLLYEFCGVVTNLVGGWAGSRTGLKATLFAGLALQIAALVMLSFLQPDWVAAISVIYVMASQALSGIAKDLTKMSSKSAVKLVVPPGRTAGDTQRALFRWVAILTGSKNALKGVGFFAGAAMLGAIGFAVSLRVMAVALAIALIAALIWLRGDLGKAKRKVKFTSILSKSRAINFLSAARFFLFGSRDIWFAVSLPIFLTEQFDWDFWMTGAFMAAWVIGYGAIQASAPAIVRSRTHGASSGARAAFAWGTALAILTAAIAASLDLGFHPRIAVLGGLAAFGVVFAVNSSVHSYLILAYSDSDRVALDVGFYYMANAGGRLVGMLLSGAIHAVAGLSGCLWTSAAFVAAAAALTIPLQRLNHDDSNRG